MSKIIRVPLFDVAPRVAADVELEAAQSGIARRIREPAQVDELENDTQGEI